MKIFSIIKNKVYLCSLFVLFFCTITIFAQEKYEHERRVDSQDVPANALKQLEELFGSGNSVKWYKEVSAEGISYEAKLKYQKRHHSVEFSETGILQDIEIIVNWADLESEVKKTIEEYFEDNYLKTKVKKLQIQLSGDLEELGEVLQENDYSDAEVKYEIEYLGTKENHSQLWEGLFDDSGEHLRSRKIILPPTVNLDF